ncbi:MAG: SDR family NAD(P)-dependent oxidoreductase [Chloroflexi bacterium]|nr:SDR family NAD(P)-dependent oxidoreductase [Chloroflexota bacterium]
MNRKLEGKVAVVTGGGSGIGRCVSIDLAEQGARVVVADLGMWTQGKPAGSQAADTVVEEIKKSGGNAVAIYDDVSTMAGGKRIVDKAVQEFGGIDILVCCAGIYKPNLIEDTTEEEWDREMAVHAKGHFSCIQPAVPIMKRQKKGRIITISSGMAFRQGLSPAYSAAKAAVLGLTRSLAIQLGKSGITVNSIIPSAGTPLFPGTGSKPTPDTVAPVIVYLATDEASSVNGQYFSVQGGDVALYSHEVPIQTLHKESKWTVEELIDIVPKTLSLHMDHP